MAISIIKIDGKEYQLGASASNVAFNNTGTGIQAGTVQRAIEEVKLTAGSGITINDGVISATGGGGDSQDVSGKADLINLVQGGDMLAVDQWPRTVVYNVTYADMDHLSVGDIYFEISNNRLYYHGQTEDIDLGSPSSTTAYLCSSDNMFYRWNGTAFVDAGLQPSEGMTDESLRRNIQIVQGNVDALRASLSNSAFSTGRPTMQPLDWDTTQVYNVRLITKALENCEVISPKESTLTVAPGGSIEIMINPSSGYSLATTTVLVYESGRPINTTVSTIGDTKIVTIANIQRDMVLTIQAKASAMSTEPVSHDVSLEDDSDVLSLSTGTVDDGTTLVVTLSVTDDGYELPNEVTVTDSDGNALDYTYDYASGTITVVNVTDDVVITAEAAQKASHTITVRVPNRVLVYDKDGELLEDFSTGTFTVNVGDDFGLFFVAGDGYKISYVTATMVYDGDGDPDSINLQDVFDPSKGYLHIPADLIVNNILVSMSLEALTYYSLTQTLTGCTSSTDAEDVVEDGELFITLTPGEGKSFRGTGAGVVVTMGGTNITQTAWNAKRGTVSISRVRGDVSITAVATDGSSHSVTYNLTDVTKVEGSTSVVDGAPLDVELEKGEGFNGLYGRNEVNNVIYPVYGFSKRDVIVFMDGVPLVPNIEYSVRQSSLDGNVLISIPNVIGDVVITNIVWQEEALDSQGDPNPSSNGCSPTVNIPIPAGCEMVMLMPNFGEKWNFYTCLYDGSTLVSSHLPLPRVFLNIDIPSGVDGIAPTFNNYACNKDANGYGTQHGDVDGLNYCYIRDVTHGLLIWKGDKVNLLN